MWHPSTSLVFLSLLYVPCCHTWLSGVCQIFASFSYETQTPFSHGEVSFIWGEIGRYLAKSTIPQGYRGAQRVISMTRWDVNFDLSFTIIFPSCLLSQNEDVLGIGTVRIRGSFLLAAFRPLKKRGLDFNLFAFLKHYNLEEAVWPGLLLISILFFKLQTQNCRMAGNSTRKTLEGQLAEPAPGNTLDNLQLLKILISAVKHSSVMCPIYQEWV